MMPHWTFVLLALTATPALAGAGNGSDVKTAAQEGTGCKKNSAVENWIAVDGSELRFQTPDLKATSGVVHCETTLVITHRDKSRLRPRAFHFAYTSHLEAGAKGTMTVTYRYKDPKVTAGGVRKVDQAGDTAMHDDKIVLESRAGECGAQTTLVVDIAAGVDGAGAEKSKLKMTRLGMLELDWEACK